MREMRKEKEKGEERERERKGGEIKQKYTKGGKKKRKEGSKERKRVIRKRGKRKKSSWLFFYAVHEALAGTGIRGGAGKLARHSLGRRHQLR